MKQNKKEKGNFPILRFKEFQGEWLLLKIRDFGKVITGNTPPTKDKENYGDDYLWASPADLGLTKYITDTKNKLSTIGYKKTRKILKNSVLITCIGSTIGKMGVASKEMSTNQQINSIEINKNHNYNYVYYAICSRFPKYLSKVEAQAVPIISKSSFEELECYSTSIEEQQKIADFLSLIDKRIEAQIKIIEKYESLIKGVKYELFSQKIRFKDNNENKFSEWEEKKLGEVGYFQTSSIDKLSREDEKEVYLVNYMNIYRHENINNETIKLFQRVTAKSTQIQSCNLKKGDILFTPSSETPDDIGHSVVIFEDLDNAVFSYHLIRFRPKIKLDITYSHYFCNISSVLNQLSKLATGSTRFTISVKSFSSVNVLIPCFLEQQKIATTLSVMDKKLKVEKQILNELIEQKKYLLQQMFI